MTDPKPITDAELDALQKLIDAAEYEEANMKPGLIHWNYDHDPTCSLCQALKRLDEDWIFHGPSLLAELRRVRNLVVEAHKRECASFDATTTAAPELGLLAPLLVGDLKGGVRATRELRAKVFGEGER